MIRLLIVDDDSSLVSIMHHSFAKRQPDWKVTSISNSRKALEMIKKDEFDVVLADLRMPEVDGEELLRSVAENLPLCIRLLHSGSIDNAKVVHALGVAHGFFEKPCSIKKIIAAIQRAHAVRLFIDTPQIIEAINSATKLPVLPNSFFDLQRIMAQGDFYLPRLISKIEQDPAVSMLIVKAANTAYFGTSMNISSVEKALLRLGINTVKSILFYSELFSQIPEATVERFHLDRLMSRSLQVGELASRFAFQCTSADDVHDEAFLAGMLSDIGKLLLVSLVPEKYEQVLALQIEQDCADRQAEIEALGVTHEQAGAYFLALWGLPISTVEAVAYHHEPQHCLVRDDSPLKYVAAAEYVLSGAENYSADLHDYFRNVGLAEAIVDWCKSLGAHEHY